MDYRHAKVFKSREDAEAQRRKGRNIFRNVRWWEEPDQETLGQMAFDAAESIQMASSARESANIRHARLYENCDIASIAGADYAGALLMQSLTGYGLVSLNVVASAIDTLNAKIAKNKPRPKFLTDGQGWDMQTRAKRADTFMQGVFFDTDIYRHAARMHVDSLVFGTGALYVFLNDKGRLEVERVHPDELFVDDMDGKYGTPQNLFRRRVMNKHTLAALFPKHAQEIYDASNEDADSTTATSEAKEDHLTVWECWHLGTDKKPGLYTLVAGGVLLDRCDWNCGFPFVFHRFKTRTTGFWGKGAAESLAGIQLELNRLVKSVSEQLRRRGRGRIYVPLGSKVTNAKLTNGIADIVHFTGNQPPVVDASNAVAQEEFLQIDRLYRLAFQEIGVSELSAMAKKPAGLDAAVAMREYSDIESERFAMQHLAWEGVFLDFAYLVLDLLDKQHSLKGYKVTAPSGRALVELDYKDIRMAKEAFVIKMFPVSSLPQTPSARYDKVVEMVRDGFITKPVAARLLDFPDLEAEQNLGNAVLEDADATISAILDNETPKLRPVEPYQNLDALLNRANAAYLHAKNHGCPEERLDLLRALIDNVTTAKTALMKPPEMPMPAGAPPGPPGGPPVNVQPNISPTINVEGGGNAAPTVPPVIGA